MSEQNTADTFPDEKRRSMRPKPTSDVKKLTQHLNRDPRFNPPTPSPWKRLALLVFVVAIFWLALTLRAQLSRPPKIIHASRYSKEFKYRPAASPIITERLKGGRTRLRGALATGL